MAEGGLCVNTHCLLSNEMQQQISVSFLKLLGKPLLPSPAEEAVQCTVVRC